MISNLPEMTDVPVEKSASRCARTEKDEEPTCSYATASSDDSDVKIKTKISDLNQTFVRIINSLKVMNVHNRNSGRERLNSNDEMLSLFDDFLNISHLLNIKINYLYNTYAPRNEIKKYISPINYKLYVFNINSFELSQEIDKGNRKHKKYQILHDLNISEMTNNVKLFNFVDDVEVDEPTSSKQDGDQEATSLKQDDKQNPTENVSDNVKEGGSTDPCNPSSKPLLTEENTANQDNLVSSQMTKKLKRKTESQSTSVDDRDESPDEIGESTGKVDGHTKKLKTAEESTENADSDSVDMYNNLFKEINNNILELSKDIDELNTLLRKLTVRQEASPDCSSNEDNSDEEREEMKKQTAMDRKLKKWQMRQMTRALIDNMVNSIQEEYTSRNEARHERSLVNEAVLMAIQRFGLQQQRDEAQASDSASTGSPPGALVSRGIDHLPSGTLVSRGIDHLPSGTLVSRSIGETLVGQRTLTEIVHNPSRNTYSRADSSSIQAALLDRHRAKAAGVARHASLQLGDAACADDGLDVSDSSDEMDEIEPDQKLTERPGKNAAGSSSAAPVETSPVTESTIVTSSSLTSSSVTSSSVTSSSVTSSSVTSSSVTSSSDQYYDDDFLTQAVTVAISKKGLSA